MNLGEVACRLNLTLLAPKFTQWNSVILMCKGTGQIRSLYRCFVSNETPL